MTTVGAGATGNSSGMSGPERKKEMFIWARSCRDMGSEEGKEGAKQVIMNVSFSQNANLEEDASSFSRSFDL